MAADDGEEFAVVDSFYRAFEDRHRGSRDLIKSRLEKYGPFVQPLTALYPGAMTFDVGCGRGEWLELMIEAGFNATGVDLDTEMLEACRERNLPAFQGDAIERLAALDSNSHALISAFHVVEHVSFEQLKTLVREALRVLKPGGLLILETPNPENIAVATCNFYIDPSHQKPVPPLLLSFVAEHAGFDRVKVVRLQEPAELKDPGAAIHFLHVLGGVSPDYAVVAQKDAGSTQGAFDQAFDTDYGLTIEALASRYETRLASSVSHVEERVQQAEELLRQSGERLVELTDRIGALLVQSQSAEERLRRLDDQGKLIEKQSQLVEQQSQLAAERNQLAEERIQIAAERIRLAEERSQPADGERQQVEHQLSEAHARLQQAEAMMHQANAQLHAVYHSTSWRITRPVRIVGLVLKGQGKAVGKAGLKRVIRRVAQFGENNPWFRRLAVSALNRVPGVKQRLISVVTGTVRSYDPRHDVPPESLSPRAQHIHASLAWAAKSYKKKERA
ncbi:methyltransferase domain-containing protein [Burkholderia stabilis]|uniref:methyltransferase domain-containing protein n=1 Tax=Burkholderia stabilis TaxID=95485 RepID=UPI0021BBBE77|nr:methyltransferase domain-containing protein [Burkholderia stabilis]